MKDGCHLHNSYFDNSCGFCKYNSLKKFQLNINRFFQVLGPKRKPIRV